MNLNHTVNRRQFLLASAGAAIIAVAPAHHAGAVVDFYRVVNGALNLRSGPGLSYSILAVLAEGTTMEIIDTGGTANGYDWVEVWVSSKSKTGFVASEFLEKVTTTPVEPAFPVGSPAATTSALNIRSGAGLSYPVIVTLWVGAPVTITGAPVAANGYNWYPIKTGYGTTGWVAGSFLTSGSVPAAPGFAVGDSVVTEAPLNLRSGAGLSYSVVVVLWQGAPLTITGTPVAATGYTWYPVKTGYGTLGWVAGEFLS